MFIVVIKRLKAKFKPMSIFLGFFFMSSLVFGAEFKCFKTSQTGDLGVKVLAIGLTDDLKWASSMVVIDDAGNRESTELGCPLFPETGSCALFDDGGVIKIEAVEGSSISVAIEGKLEVFRVLPEDYVYIRVSAKDDQSRRVLELSQVSSTECSFY